MKTRNELKGNQGDKNDKTKRIYTERIFFH